MSDRELPFHKSLAQLEATAACSSHAKDFSPPDSRFISRRRYSDVDASHFKLLMSSWKGSPLGICSSSPECPATPEERAYGRRMARMSSGRTEGGVLTSSAGANMKDVFGSPTKERPMPKSPDQALQMTDIADDLDTNILSWSSKYEVAIALNKTVYIWNSITGRHKCIYWDEGSGRRRAFRRRSTTETPNRRLSQTELEREGNPLADCVVCSLAWHHNGRLLAMGLEDGTIRVWDSLEASHVPQIENREIACCTNNAANAVCWGPQNTIYSGHHCGCILQVTLIKNDNPTLDTLLETTYPVSSIAVSEHKKYLAVSTHREVLIWQLADRLLYRRLAVHQQDIVKGLLFLPWNPDILARGTCREQGKHSRITLWHVMSESIVADVGVESQVCSLVANRETKELISGHGGEDNCICVWSSPDLDMVGKLPGHNCRVIHLAVSPDSTKLASCSPDQVLKIWSCFDQSSVRVGCEKKRTMSAVSASLDPILSNPKTGASFRSARRSSLPTIQSPLLGKCLR